MDHPEASPNKTPEKSDHENRKQERSVHIGSSNAFTKTESPLSKDADDISDERLDELLDKEQ